MPPRAVLFDFDGVIADTENIHIAAWERTFAIMGWDVSPVVCARASEEDDREFLVKLFASRGIEDGDTIGWVRRKQALTVSMLADFPRVYPGLTELVGLLDGKAKLAVVSGTWRENIVTVLKAARLEGSFSLIVAKEDVAKTKPDPEAYVLALKGLGVAPTQAVALEDCPTGLASANSAGIRAVAVGHRREPGDWTSGLVYLPSLADPASAMAILGGSRWAKTGLSRGDDAE
ncbi:MAG: haloacid dehalogenase superfamily protein subfamily variant 3 with third motif having or [Planctomycetota bacterium]|nr:haloacid dehalogenase superfamily protein subfamily variant 3 with third motif having or [Planctomycetota bacterium]